MIEMINKVYTGIQQLQIQPSRHNIGILAECLQILENIAQEIAADAGEGADGETDGPETDADGAG